MPIFLASKPRGRATSLNSMNSKWRKRLHPAKNDDLTDFSPPLPPLPHIDELPTPKDSGHVSPVVSIRNGRDAPPDDLHSHRSVDKSLPGLDRRSSRSCSSADTTPSLPRTPGVSHYSANQTLPLRIDEGPAADLLVPPSEHDTSSSVYITIDEPKPKSRRPALVPKEFVTPGLSNDRSPTPLLPLRIEDGSDAPRLQPVREDDPLSFKLVGNDMTSNGVFDLEKQAQLLFSSQHLWQILSDTNLNRDFATFLHTKRPWRKPFFNYYTSTVKAIRALEYANSLATKIHPVPGYPFTTHPTPPLRSSHLEKQAQEAFEDLATNDLPPYISHTWISLVSITIHHRITGLPTPSSAGLAEVFCLTDPSRPDNPIVMASREFSRTTQYGSAYVLGRNCRFLQGPHTSRAAVERVKEAIRKEKSCLELILNYRRDGTPFLNLLSIAPLLDDEGRVMYFLGAQIDVSNLAKGCYGLEGLRRLVEGVEREGKGKKGVFEHLVETFDEEEVDCVRRFAGTGGKEFGVKQVDEVQSRVIIRDDPGPLPAIESEKVASVVLGDMDGILEGVFQHFLLVRPAPSFRILFTSPSLRAPGIQQSVFPDRIGGSINVRNSVIDAMRVGRDVTAKILWKINEYEGQARWVHCTPLYTTSDHEVGVWMVVFVDDTKTHHF